MRREVTPQVCFQSACLLSWGHWGTSSTPLPTPSKGSRAAGWALGGVPQAVALRIASHSHCVLLHSGQAEPALGSRPSWLPGPASSALLCPVALGGRWGVFPLLKPRREQQRGNGARGRVCGEGGLTARLCPELEMGSPSRLHVRAQQLVPLYPQHSCPSAGRAPGITAPAQESSGPPALLPTCPPPFQLPPSHCTGPARRPHPLDDSLWVPSIVPNRALLRGCPQWVAPGCGLLARLPR